MEIFVTTLSQYETYLAIEIVFKRGNTMYVFTQSRQKSSKSIQEHVGKDIALILGLGKPNNT